MRPALLIVDDNPKNLQSMEALLADVGGDITLANSGKAALLEVLKKDFALILLDVQMPELDGYETARLIRQRERSRTVPIIFVTAHHRTDEGVLKAYQLGAVDFLFKPVVTEILKAKVQVFLELHARTQEVREQAELIRGAQKREHERSLAAAKVDFERKRLEEQAARDREHYRQQALAHARLERHAARLQLLTESADELLRAQDAASCWKIAATRLMSSLQADGFLRFEPSPNGDGFVLADAFGFKREQLEDIQSLSSNAPLLKWAQSSARRSAHDSVTQFPMLEAIGCASCAAYPVLRDGALAQLFVLSTCSKRSFDEDDLSLLQITIDQTLVAVERANLLGALREADRRKDEFIAMLGHELRNPLTPIQNSLEVLRVRTADDAVARRSIDAADRQVRHVVRLVDDLLDVSRITRGKVELRRQQVPLLPLIEQALHAVEPIARRKNQTLEKHLPDDETLCVDADPNRLVQVLANLLGNAAKYTPGGGRIQLDVDVNGSDLHVRVSDTGIGISSEMLPRIFDIFVQAAPSADRADAGLGIGLTLARRLAELHGGALSALSEGLGKGSTFRLDLPGLVLHRTPHHEAAPERRRAPVKAPAAPLEVLLIEDNQDIRETLKDLLSLHGHEVHEAADGAEGLRLLQELEPDLALIDIGLPELDGYTVASRARERSPDSPTRLVALTGYGTEEDRKKALEAGFHAHLSKPVTFDDLLALIARLGLNADREHHANEHIHRDQRPGA